MLLWTKYRPRLHMPSGSLVTYLGCAQVEASAGDWTSQVPSELESVRASRNNRNFFTRISPAGLPWRLLGRPPAHLVRGWIAGSEAGPTGRAGVGSEPRP